MNSITRGGHFLVAVLAVLAMSSLVQADLIVNGSFEQASVDPGASFKTLGSGSTAITGWTVGGSGIDYIGGYWTAADGARSIDLSAGTTGKMVAQSFATTIDKYYEVTFAMAGNPAGDPSTKSLRVAAADQSAVFSFSTIGHTRANMGWVEYSWVFKAIGNTTELSFLSLVPTAYGPALDNVRVEAVPAPAAALLGVFGLGLTGWVKRRFA